MTDKCVHTEHCCVHHGCKYRDANCPVELGIKIQSYPCEDCDRDQVYKILLRSSDLCGNRSEFVIGYSKDKEDLKMKYAFFELIAIPIEVEDSTTVKKKAIKLIETGKYKLYE